MEGTLTPEDGGRGRIVRFAALYVLAWVVALLALGILELLVDPELQNRVGEVLDIASIAIAAVGVFAVPIGVLAYSRAAGERWPLATGIAGVSLLAYLAGVGIDTAIYWQLEGS